MEELVRDAAIFNPNARAELEWTAAAMAIEWGDDAAELAALRDLAPLLAGIEDPFLHAVSELAIAWALPITGDFEGALREVSASLEDCSTPSPPWLHPPPALWRRP